MALSRAQPCAVYVKSGQLTGSGLSLFGVGLRKNGPQPKRKIKQIGNWCFGGEGVLSESLVKRTFALPGSGLSDYVLGVCFGGGLMLYLLR